MNIQRIATFLDEYLEIKMIEDDCNNGLQVECSQPIKKTGFAVDACMDVFRKAQNEQCQMVIVHHGMIWRGIDFVRGDIYRRLKFLIENDIGLYAAHLPLDVHIETGNNVQMADLLGLEPIGAFHLYKNTKIGMICLTDIELDELAQKVQNHFGEYMLLPFGKTHVKRVGIVTGSGTQALDSCIEAGCDTFITGEAKHGSYHKAKENNLNVLFAGHYKTETLGVKALMEKVRDMFKTETVFLNVPTGL